MLYHCKSLLVLKIQFKGVVDLINWRGIVWNEHDKGMTFTEVPIPADLIEEATEWREKLLESVAEYDDGPDGEILRCSRYHYRARGAWMHCALQCSMLRSFRWYVVHPSKTRVYKPCWIM